MVFTMPFDLPHLRTKIPTKIVICLIHLSYLEDNCIIILINWEIILLINVDHPMYVHMYMSKNKVCISGMSIEFVRLILAAYGSKIFSNFACVILRAGMTSPFSSSLQPSLIVLVSTSWLARSVHLQSQKILSWFSTTKKFR